MAVKVRQFMTGQHEGATYSGSDMIVFFAFPNYKPVEVGTVSTLSYTIYREKKQIRTIGRISPKGITKGTRTISGKMIFTVLHEHVAESLRREIPYLQKNKILLMDELPPFDIIVSFGNEYGSSAGMVIQGVTTVDEQKNFSIEELFTENIFTYIARRIEPMRDTSPYVGTKWDPFSIHTSSFRSADSEMIGRFTLDDLIIKDFADRLKKYDPFIHPTESWKTVDVNVDMSPIEIGDLGTGGSGDVKDDTETKKPAAKNATHTVYVVQKNAAATPIKGATVYFDKQTAKTDSKGQAKFTTKASQERATIYASASGYTTSQKYSWGIKSKNKLTVPLVKKVASIDKKQCMNDPTAKISTGEVKPEGYWFEEGATKKYIKPKERDGKITYMPRPQVEVVNACDSIISGINVFFEYEVTNWSSVKGNGTWDEWDFNFGKIKEQKNFIDGWGTTDKKGIAQMPKFNFGKFPRGSKVRVYARPCITTKYKDVQNIVPRKNACSFYFECKD